MTKIRYKDRFKIVYNDKSVTVHDSIPYPVKVEVEKKQTFIDKVVMGFGVVTGLLLIVFFILVVCNFARKH